MAVQSDGKIVAAGYASMTSADFAVARYNTDGTLDDTFAGSGTVTTDFFNELDYAQAVAIQADGKIVAGGLARMGTEDVIAIVRYNPDGSLDMTFSGDGKAYTDFGLASELTGLAIQSDGKIVAVGGVYPAGGAECAVVRYNTDGSLDTSFSVDGKVLVGFGSTSSAAKAVAVQTDGKIVIAGYAVLSTGVDFAVARLTSAGALDTTFSLDGKLTTDFFGLRGRGKCGGFATGWQDRDRRLRDWVRHRPKFWIGTLPPQTVPWTPPSVGTARPIRTLELMISLEDWRYSQTARSWQQGRRTPVY